MELIYDLHLSIWQLVYCETLTMKQTTKKTEKFNYIFKLFKNIEINIIIYLNIYKLKIFKIV